MKILIALAFIILTFSYSSIAQKRIYPFIDLNLERYDSLVICLTDLINYIDLTSYAKYSIDSVSIDSFQVKIIVDKDLILKSKDALFIRHEDECSSMTPWYHLSVFADGDELVRYHYCTDDQMNWAGLESLLKIATLKVLDYSSINYYNKKLESIKTQKNAVLLKTTIDEDGFMIWYFEYE